MTVTLQPRIINGNTYEMPTVDGMDRCQINTRLHYINEELSKIQAKQAALIAMRDQLDRHAEMQEMGNLFDEMFGGWMNTTTATYSIQVTTPGGHLSFLKDMPTRPKTHKGIKSQNNKLSKWVEKCYPDFTSYEVILLD